MARGNTISRAEIDGIVLQALLETLLEYGGTKRVTINNIIEVIEDGRNKVMLELLATQCTITD